MSAFSQYCWTVSESRSKFCVHISMCALFLVLVGCGQGTDVQRYTFSGQVTYGGKPVPRGDLRFVPDKEKGNSGPGTSASIVDGHYQTLPEHGAISGPHIVYIFGADGKPIDKGDGIPPNPNGSTLFPEYEVRVDIPKEASTHDFEVPVTHGQENLAGQKEPAKQKQE